MKNWMVLTWGISNQFGWGVYGLNLTLELLKRGAPVPIVLDTIQPTLPPDILETLRPVIDFHNQLRGTIHKNNQVAKLRDAVVLHSMGNYAQRSLMSHAFEGDVNVGVIFFEYTNFEPANIAQLRKFNAVVGGSTWNADVMRQWGVENVHAVFQGVDTALFRPLPRTGKYKDKFAVFSGGKIDFRKSQDIVLEAFKIFSRRHDDAVLVTAWHSLWPLTALPFIHSPYTKTLPGVRSDDMLNIAEWAAQHGIRPEQFVDLGIVPNGEMPAILADMDVAVFPNRCEGGTNLVAMETMACGVPCIIADNTGQKDLIGDGNCIPLTRQTASHLPGTGTDGWGESDVEEIVEALEAAYSDRDAMRSVGDAGARFMADWTWSKQISKLLDVTELYS